MTLYGDDDNPIIETLIGADWIDISSRVRNEQKVTISRGRASEQGRPNAQRANMTLDNTDGFFSTRLPTSVNYGLIGKNTQVRVLAGRGGNHLHLPFNDRESLIGAYTIDKATLDITGDIDIRADIRPHSWRPTKNLIIASKYALAGDQRSWVLQLTSQGRLSLTWSTDGTFAGNRNAQTGVFIPPTSGRLAIRVTVDVNNGAAGRDTIFYTAPTIAGPWTQFGITYTAPEVTSFYASTADLCIGRGADTRNIFSTSMGFGGAFYGFELRNGINGTLVANMDPTSRLLDDTSWSDGLPTANAWNILGQGARISSDRVRFWGEFNSLPKRWDRTGTDVTVPAQASGLLRRLSQGAKPLSSAMYRNFTQYSPFSWWPLEDASGSTQAANAAGNAPAARVTNVNFGGTSAPPGAAGALQFIDATSRFIARTPARTPPSTTISFVIYMKLSALPAGSIDSPITIFLRTGSIRLITVGVNSTSWEIRFWDNTGSLVTSSGTAIGLINPVNGWVGYNLLLKQSGANFTYSQRWDTIGTYGGGMGPVTVLGQSLGPVNAVTLSPIDNAVFNDAQFSHVFLAYQDLDLSMDVFRNASNAYNGETAAARLQRLSDEEGVPIEITGVYADSEPMGYQTPRSYPDLAAECWEVDGGIGGDARDALTLAYRTRSSMESREDLRLTYSLSDLADVPDPSDDDLGLTNDVTVKRTLGSSARAVVEAGANSILAPPLGVGRYETEQTLNVANDARLPSIAGWLALVGTWDQDRYPSVTVALHRRRLLADDTLFWNTLAANLGDTLVLADLPPWMPPDDVPELIQGYDEVLSRFLWQVTYNATPAGPYRSVAVLGSDAYVPRLDATTHTTGGALNTSSTSVLLVTPAGSARWVDSATYPTDFPMDIVIGGEVMSLTLVTGTTSPQSGTVVRSVNGVVKSHSSGASVRLARPFYVGR